MNSIDRLLRRTLQLQKPGGAKQRDVTMQARKVNNLSLFTHLFLVKFDLLIE
jgi:hypothetical protein